MNRQLIAPKAEQQRLAEERRKLEAEEEEKRLAKERLPDREKLQEFVTVLQSIQYPTMSTDWGLFRIERVEKAINDAIEIAETACSVAEFDALRNTK